MNIKHPCLPASGIGLEEVEELNEGNCLLYYTNFKTIHAPSAIN